jgi:3-hydroxyisobutyrate dehydrogenase
MKIGFIGLGTMGGPMALNLRRAGFDLRVSDLRPEAAERHVAAGATFVADVSELAAQVDLLLTSLPGPPQVEAVARLVGPAMRPGSAWFDLSTSSPTLARRLHAEFAERGVALADAPVSGGPAGAKSGKLALWVGAEADVFERYRPALDAIGDQVILIGPIGAGSVAKLVHNCAGYAMQLALVELFTMGVKAGVDPLPLWAAIRQGSLGRKRSFDRIGEQFLQGTFDPPNFALGLAHKDVSLALELAREHAVPMRLAQLTHAEMTDALNRGWEGRDSRSYLILQQERAGLAIRVPREDVEKVIARDG